MSQPPPTHQPPQPRQPARPAIVTGAAPAFGASDLTESVAARVQDILASAHETAESVREQAAAATRDMIAQAQATVDRDTERIRRDVEARAAQYLAECHRRVDAFADARVRRLRELSDSLIEQTDALHSRFGQIVRLSEQLDGLIASLGGAAEQTARELKRPAISLPTVAQFHGEDDAQPLDPAAGLDPAGSDDLEGTTAASTAAAGPPPTPDAVEPPGEPEAAGPPSEPEAAAPEAAGPLAPDAPGAGRPAAQENSPAAPQQSPGPRDGRRRRASK
jgi:hypothetical protein